MGVVDTADAAYLLKTGKVRLARPLRDGRRCRSGLRRHRQLPAASYGPIVYWAAETHHAMSPNVAEFVAFLRQPEAQERIKADGLEVLP